MKPLKKLKKPKYS